MEDKVVESINQVDKSGREWRIDRTEDKMYLYYSEDDNPLAVFDINEFEIFCELRSFIHESSTRELWEFIRFEIPGENTKKLPKDPPTGLIFYN